MKKSLTRYMRVFDSSSELIPLQTPLPDLSTLGSAGSTDALAVRVELFDKVTVCHGLLTDKIQNEDCLTLADLAAKLASGKNKLELRATCSQQVIFHTSATVRDPLPHSTLLPSIDELKTPLTYFVSSMSKTIWVCQKDKYSDPGDNYEEVLIQSDDDLLKYGHMLKYVDKNKLSDKSSFKQVHQLVDGGRYAFRVREDFQGWQRVHSAAMEDAIGRRMLSHFGAALKPISRVIHRPDRNGKFQEWDAAFCDHRDKLIYLAEAKHEMTLDRLEDVRTKKFALPEFLKTNKEPGYPHGREVSDYKFMILVAAELFDKALVSKAFQFDFHVCYPSGDAYNIFAPSKLISPSGM